MPAYVIANIEVSDPGPYEAYKTAAAASIARHGGRYLVRGGHSEVVEGAFPGSRFVVIVFEDRAAANAFVASEDYAAAKAHRLGAAAMNMVVVDGLDP
jgi:uncharacterized protein (DUF1330 family)